ncbi:hypothetical protein RYX56_19595 [Alkalihalophilus lindianensis]|uniref:Tetratricopeptide repeat protein n=1 Tax=Alkalihalophilus lindianensis TaxID=1630542 RepID=A0ABU3XF97_9BACI|nr:hypothetical protein [Alkalihalophilus lindianensis]MDV2686569.1 hypothetical protein [Alkalihalophilus lindianensis]
MHPTEWILNHNQEQIILQANKLTLFQQCKIIECVGSDNLHYLLFFHKDDFLTVQPLVEFDQASFLGHLEQKGSCIHAPSPLFSLLLPAATSLKIISADALLTKIKKQYSSIETALIYSYFDSYIPSEQLDIFLKEIFYTFRRDGKLLAAYRLGIVLLSRGYQKEWLRSAIEHADYAHAKNHFQSPLITLMTTDPLYVEQQLFSSNNYTQLLELYQEQNRVIDSLILYINVFIKRPSPTEYKNLITVLNNTFTNDEILSFLRSLLPVVSTETGLHQDVYHRLIKNKETDAAVGLLFHYPFPLSKKDIRDLPELLNHLSISTLELSLQSITQRLLPLVRESPQTFEKIICATLPNLLNRHTLADIYTHLKLNEEISEIPSLSKISDMYHLVEDAENQLKLGMYYYDLGQYEKAIECFSWEMELHSNQVEPIQWLAKAYQKVGKHKEVETYHNLLKQMKHSS